MNSKKRVAFIDLEDTVIAPVLQGWPAAEPIALANTVRQFLEVWEPDEVRVFSFAIHSEEDLKGFESHVQPWLERLLGFKIAQRPQTIQDIIEEVSKMRRLHPSKVGFSDLVDFLGKGGAFKECMRSEGRKNDGDLEVVLLDDCVEDETFEFPAVGVVGRLVNVERL